jgi:O-antigen ligase
VFPFIGISVSLLANSRNPVINDTMLSQTSTGLQTPFRWTVILLAGLLLLSPALYFEAFHNPAHVPRIILLSIIAVVASLSLVYVIWNKDKGVYLHWIFVVVLAFLLWATLSILWTIDFGNYAYQLIPLWALVLVFFVSARVASINSTKLLIVASFAGAMYATVIALLQNYGFNPVGFRILQAAVGSTFVNNNHFGLYLDLIIPLALCLVVITTNVKLRWLFAILTGMMLGMLLELQTRGSWLALLTWLIFLVIVLVASRKKSAQVFEKLWSRKFELTTVALIAMLIFLSYGATDRRNEAGASQARILDSSARIRLHAYQNSLGMIREKPLKGAGYGAFWKGFRFHMNHPRIIQQTNEGIYLFRLHNDPLQIFTELGIPGGLLVIFLVICIMYMGVRLYTTSDDRDEQLISLALLMAVVACSAHALVDFPLQKPSSAIQFWVVVGLISGLYIKKFRQPVKISKSYLVGLCLIISIYTPVATAFHYKHARSNYYHRIASVAMEENDCPGAVDNIDRAIQEGNFYVITHVTRVQYHIKCKRDDKALFEVLNEELAWDETNTMALLYRGYILKNNGYYDHALKDFNQIILLLPHRLPAKIGLVKTLIAMQKYDQAQASLLEIQKDHPDSRELEHLANQLKQRVIK